MFDQDLLEQIYYLIDESLPVRHYPDPAERALCATFTPEQEKLFDAYVMEAADKENKDRLQLFFRLLKQGLYIP